MNKLFWAEEDIGLSWSTIIYKHESSMKINTAAIEISKTNICKNIKQSIICLSSLKLKGVQLIWKSLEY